MGQCCRKQERPQSNVRKQNKNIDDKRMLKVGIEVMKKDFCVQTGYNRRAVAKNLQRRIDRNTFKNRSFINP